MEAIGAALIAAALLVALFIALLALSRGRLSGKARLRKSREDAEERSRRRGSPAAIGPGICPLCAALLEPGDRVKSDIYPGKGDRIMRIFGCPQCWPSSSAVPRACPVCGQELRADSWAVARYFEKPGRRHVHVLGCTQCRERWRDQA